MHPIERMGDPEEIANAVIRLLPDNASFVSDHTLLVDGGWGQSMSLSLFHVLANPEFLLII